MSTDRRGEIRPALMSAIFVLLLPLLLIYGTFAVIDLWPVSTAVDEVAIFGMHSILVAFATVAFLSHVKISAGEFAVFSIVGPFVTFTATAVSMGGVIQAYILLFLTKFYAAGFIVGLIAHRYLLRR